MKKIIFFLFYIYLFAGYDTSTLVNRSSIHLIANGYINGIEYYCDNNQYQDITKNNGTFDYNNCKNKITFKIGSIKIGSINTTDISTTNIYLTNLLGYDTNDTNHTNLINILKILQALDSYNNGDPRDNIIEVNQTVIDLLKNSANISYNMDLLQNNINENDLKQILRDANVSEDKLNSTTKALTIFERYLKDNNINVDNTKPFTPEFITPQKHPFIYILKTNYDNFIGTRNDGSTGNFKISIFGEKGNKVYLNNTPIGTVKNDWTFYITLKHNWNKLNEFNITLEDENNKTSDPLQLKIYKIASNPTILNTTFNCNNDIFDLNISDYDLLRAYNELNLTTSPHTIKIDDKDVKIIDFNIDKYQDEYNITRYNIHYDINCSNVDFSKKHNLKIIQNKTFNAFIREGVIP